MTVLRALWRWLTAHTESERARFEDGSPRTRRIVDDGMARLTLIKGLAPGKQRVIRGDTER